MPLKSKFLSLNLRFFLSAPPLHSSNRLLFSVQSSSSFPSCRATLRNGTSRTFHRHGYQFMKAEASINDVGFRDNDLKTHRLDETMPEIGDDEKSGDKVNFNDPERKAHPVYTTIIISAKGSPRQGNPSPGWTDDDNIYIVPARIGLRIEEDFAWLDTAILKPASAEGKELRNEGPAAQINFEDARRAWTLLVDLTPA